MDAYQGLLYIGLRRFSRVEVQGSVSRNRREGAANLFVAVAQQEVRVAAFALGPEEVVAGLRCDDVAVRFRDA